VSVENYGGTAYLNGGSWSDSTYKLTFDVDVGTCDPHDYITNSYCSWTKYPVSANAVTSPNVNDFGAYKQKYQRNCVTIYDLSIENMDGKKNDVETHYDLIKVYIQGDKVANNTGFNFECGWYEARPHSLSKPLLDAFPCWDKMIIQLSEFDEFFDDWTGAKIDSRNIKTGYYSIPFSFDGWSNL
jgi:hypothetical protein